MKTRSAFILGILLGLPLKVGFGIAAESPITPKTAFQQVDRLSHTGLSEEAWLEAQKKAAMEALSKLQVDKITGPDLYFLGVLEAIAGQWKGAVDHLQKFLALPPSDDHDTKMNGFSARIKLQEAFIKSGRVADGEKYYASDPITLGVFVSMNKEPERAIKIYEDYLETNPTPENARRAKSLILYALEEMKKPEEVARRLDLYRKDLTANTVVNTYSTLSRMYFESGNQAKSDQYTDLVLDMGKNSKEGKAVDGPVFAHVDWIIKRLETSGEADKLNAFLERVRTELSGNKGVMDHLAARETFRAVLNQPAKDLEIDFFLNGKPTTLKELRGRVVLLDFFAHWCGPCIAGFPGVRDLQKKYESKGLVVLGISGIYGFYKGQRGVSVDEELKRMKEDFAKEYEVTWPMIFAKSKTNEKNYGVGYIPHLVLIDRQGVIRHMLIGKGYEEGLVKEVEKLLSPPASPGDQ